MTSLTTPALVGYLEAMLFAYGEPVTIKKLSSTLEAAGLPADEMSIKEAIAQLQKNLADEQRGLSLIVIGDRIQLTTKSHMADAVAALIRAELSEELTPAALETLSVVCYGAPVPRSSIDFVRGVNSSFALRSLLMRGLIERSQDPKNASGYVYRPSFELLRSLGMERVELLPDYEKFNSLIAHVVTTATELTETKPPTP